MREPMEKYIANIPVYMGMSEKMFLNCCIPAKKKLMKSLASKVKIDKGTVITMDMLQLKCPGDGILWKNAYKICGHVAAYNIPNDVTVYGHMVY